MRKVLLTLFVAACVASAANAQTATSDYEVIHEADTVWNFGYNGVNLYSRKMHRIDISYLSKDHEDNDVTLSGYVAIPYDIYNGSQPCDGILLYNHYTQMSKDYAPTNGYSIGEDFVMANPLSPNYIVVSSDFQGFGVSADMPQAYCYGDYNGQASIDMLLASRKLLDDRNMSQGKFLFNAGYSSGGYDAIATQRVRDMHYRDEIVFDKTFTGGAPFDIMEACRYYISHKDDENIDVVCMPMVLDVFNHLANLGFTYDQMFKEPYNVKFQDWIASGTYNTKAVMDSLEGKKLSEIMQDNFLSTYSDEYYLLRDVASKYSLAKDWTPDFSQKYYVMHLVRDNTVPASSGREFLRFLSSFKYEGTSERPFMKSIVPERTRLQTNFVIPDYHHTIVGGLVFYLNLAATMTAYPVLYYDDELNTHYADLVEDATVMGIIHKLEEKGYDVRGAVQKLTNGGTGGSFFDVLAQIENTLNNLGTNTSEVLQMADDSGLELVDLMQIYMYLTTPADSEAANHGIFDEAETVARPSETEPYLTDYYQQYLQDWLKENNVDVFDQAE